MIQKRRRSSLVDLDHDLVAVWRWPIHASCTDATVVGVLPGVIEYPRASVHPLDDVSQTLTVAALR